MARVRAVTGRYGRPGVNRKKSRCACSCVPFPLSEDGTPAEMVALTSGNYLIIDSLNSSLDGATPIILKSTKDGVLHLDWTANGPVSAGGFHILTGATIVVGHVYEVTLSFQLGGVISYCPQTFFAIGANP